MYETDPSGVYSEYKAFAIGSRSQSARTYFERHVDLFEDANVSELITHGLRALQASANDTALTLENTTVAVVGKETPFEIYKDAQLEPYINVLSTERAAQAAAAAAAPAEDVPPPAAVPAGEELYEEMEMD